MSRLGFLLLVACLGSPAESADWKKVGGGLELDLDSIRRESSIATYTVRMRVRGGRDKVDHVLIDDWFDCATRRSRGRRFTAYTAAGVPLSQWWSNAQASSAAGTPGGSILKRVCQ